jgi:hypothetical protein
VKQLPKAVRVAASTSLVQQELGAALTARGISVGAGPLVTAVGSEDNSRAAQPAAATVAVGKPYVLASSAAPIRLAVYSDVPASIDAVADVLTGQASAPGHLPVPVSGASGC